MPNTFLREYDGLDHSVMMSGHGLLREFPRLHASKDGSVMVAGSANLITACFSFSSAT